MPTIEEVPYNITKKLRESTQKKLREYYFFPKKEILDRGVNSSNHSFFY